MLGELDRFRGCIMGLAVGDALGHPTEFIASVRAVRARWGEQGINNFEANANHPPGTFTDDTQMTIAAVRALIGRRIATIAFAEALALAATAGRFDIVAELVRELEARRLARAPGVS
jgi:ADP-ribosylglycohydrolase